MLNLDYSMKVRDFVIDNAQFAFEVLNFCNIDDRYQLSIFWESFNSLEEDLPFRVGIDSKKGAGPINYKQAQVLARLSKIQMITDHYRYSKLNDICENDNTCESFPQINTFEDIDIVFKNLDLSNELLDSLLEYAKASLYDKILLSKSLDENDIDYLSKINPFFIMEHQKYNIDVDINFINNQIRTHKNISDDEMQNIYNDAANFIVYMYTIDKEKTLPIIEEILNNVNSNIVIKNSYPDTPYINYKGMIIDEMVLGQIIKDYYESKNAKKLLYGRDENGNK